MAIAIRNNTNRTLPILRILATLVLSSYLFAGMFMLNLGMHHDGMKVLGCTAGFEKAVCVSDPGQHLSWWAKAFASATTQPDLQLLLSVIGVAIFLGYVAVIYSPSCPALAGLRVTAKDPPESRFNDFTLEYYARGNAEPRLYA